MSFEQHIDQITSDRHLHGRFLQHLSALEKSGHQKLLRLKHRYAMSDENFLSHLADEARHAAHLKKLSQTLIEAREQIGLATKNYLTKLEVFILRELRRRNLESNENCYVVLTYVIEQRAQKFYPTYENILAQKQSNLSVGKIIEDESEHLAMMESKMSSMHLPTSILTDAACFEEDLFRQFLAQF